MIGKIFGVIMPLSFVTAIFTGNVQRLSFEMLEAISGGVTLCISLLGMMCFWNGIMNVFKECGILNEISKLVDKPLDWIFGKNNLTANDKQNLSASFAADFLGLGNAALPFGIAAMKGLSKGKTESASDSAIMHAVLNTVPIQLVPATLIALRSRHGSVNPFDVIPAIWFCSAIITVFAVVVCKMFAKISKREKKDD
ncbi:MAG: ABC transporter permease [Clostridia bacterium]|nr:ABC transporter permease [Clostridia bacterium]